MSAFFFSFRLFEFDGGHVCSKLAPAFRFASGVGGLPPRVAAVRFGPVRGQNLNPDLRSGSRNFANLNLSRREPRFRSGSGSSGV